uniref:Glyco_18 domain-containing protein n=1 Tax=Caenorhabditis japonica TaxID=281687 RepID=A0A8R1DFR2_CAEJA
MLVAERIKNCFIFLAFCAILIKTEESEILETLHFKPGLVTKSSILKDHETMDDKFYNPNDRDGITQLAYITPWNHKGYKLAVETAHKLTHVSPVWFQVKFGYGKDKENECNIEGIHEINREWISNLTEKNPKIKIVPRILFDGWSFEDMQILLEDTNFARRCFNSISNFYSRNQFNGAVVEFYMQALIALQSLQYKDLMIEIMQDLSKKFRKLKLSIVYTVPAPLDWNNKPNNLVTPTDYHKILAASDFVQIMTYDYHGNEPSGVAPYGWFENCIFYLKDNTFKTLAGLNFYGYEFSGGKLNSIVSDRFLEVLRNKKSILEFDKKSMEHRLRTESSIIYFPSLSSLELRINMAHRYGVGIAIWDYGQGLNYFTNLLV